MHLVSYLSIFSRVARACFLMPLCFAVLLSSASQAACANDLCNAKVKPVIDIKAYPFDLHTVRLLDSPLKKLWSLMASIL
jgi:hypothetical protein